MKILFASGTPHLPQVAGGIEVNTHQLTHELLKRRHEPSVLAKLSSRDLFGAKKLARMAVSRDRISVDREQGYSVYRSRYPWGDLRDVPRPEIAVVQNGGMVPLAQALGRVGVRSVAYFHGLEFESWDPALREDVKRLPFLAYIANSEFTAGRFKEIYGLDCAIIPPLIRPELYLTERTGRHVTFINPVPVKGVDLAIEIARLCPEIPFCFVRGWPLRSRARWRLESALRKLPNATLRESAADMRRVYRTTRLLLVPSQWEAETWGRVVSEAQVSGIPVVASDRGGLREAVGPGGVIVGHDRPPEEWATALRDLWHDRATYETLSAAALAHSRREDLDSNCQIERFVALLESTCASLPRAH